MEPNAGLENVQTKLQKGFRPKRSSIDRRLVLLMCLQDGIFLTGCLEVEK